MREYYIYILSSYNRILYIGITNDLQRRVQEHQQKLIPGFTARYNINELVYVETFREVQDALEREKQLKRWTRAKKIKLIKSRNPRWEDLSSTF